MTAAALSTELPEEDRLRRFADAIDAIRRRVEAEVGDEDVAYMRRVNRFSKRMELLGRTLLHVSLDPVTFAAGVTALWVHKQLQAFEIGHTALHGVFDRFPDAKEFHARTFAWDVPVDERTWISTHNGHHANVNVAGKDDILHFGLARAHTTTPWHWYHRFQVPYLALVLLPSFGFSVNIHVTGLSDVLFGNGRPEKFDFIEDRSFSTIASCARKAVRKFAPYYAKNYVFYPLLAGPFFPKVLLGNFLAETMRDLWMGATILSNHVADTATYGEDARPRSRGEYYAMQVEATHDFAVSLPVSILCGGLDLHIEHHLFPRVPPNRLREVQAEVQAACEAHGVRYRREPWPKLLKKVARKVVRMSRPTATENA